MTRRSARSCPRATPELDRYVGGILEVELPEVVEVVIVTEDPKSFRSSIYWDIMEAFSPARLVVFKDPVGLQEHFEVLAAKVKVDTLTVDETTVFVAVTIGPLADEVVKPW